MKLKVTKSTLSGEIEVPGSKSHTIRAVAIATFANGKSKIVSPLISDDTISALEAAKLFQAKVVKKDGVWEVEGAGGEIEPITEVIDMGNSGTSLRIFTGLAGTLDSEVKFDGDSSLRSRPMNPILDAISKLGVQVKSNEGRCPLSVNGPIKPGKTVVDGTSSQFLTSLLFSLPLAKGDSEVDVVNLNEIPYVHITLDWLNRQGIEMEYADDLSWFKIKGNQSYKPFERVIPADFSTATSPLIAAAVTKSTIKIKNLDFQDQQGDKATFDYLEKMGAKVERHKDYTVVSCDSELIGCELDLNATPDALPAMSVVACFAKGETRLVNVAQARIKETDRIACMTAELKKLGADVEELEDGMIIRGGTPLHAGEVESYHDHRIAMALAIAGMGIDGETVIRDAEAASVTYPNFINDFATLGANFTKED